MSKTVSQHPRSCTLKFVLQTILSINFFLYSTQSYVPPSTHSLSYSILNCPSHSAQSPLSHIILYITKSEKENRSEKHCFCVPSNINRSLFIVSKSTFDVLINEYITYLLSLNENLYLKENLTNLLIRSPPLLSTIVLENLELM